MLKKRLCVILLILMLLTCTGCWDRVEPQKLAEVNSALYDIRDNGQYRVVYEIVNPTSSGGTGGGGGGGNEKSPYTIASGEGDSFREAIGSIMRSTEKNIFGGHNKVRLFTECFAQKEMLSMLEFVARARFMDETSLMIVIKDAVPEDIHFSAVGLSDLMGDYLEDLANEHMRRTSKSVSVTTLDFIKDCYLEGKQPVMGVAELAEGGNKSSGNTVSGGGGDDDAPQIILYEGLAAFKDNRLVGYMNGIEARAYNIVVNTVDASYISVHSGDRQTVMKIDSSKADLKTFLEDDRIIVRVNIKAKLHVVEESGNLDVSKAEPLKTVEARFNELMQSEVEAAIRKAQTEFRSDIFGFGRQVNIQHPDRWPEFKENWDDHFADATVEVTVESSVTRTGQIKEPLALED